MATVSVVVLTAKTLARLEALGVDDSAGDYRWHNKAIPRGGDLFDVPVSDTVADMLFARLAVYKVDSIDELLNLFLDLAASAGKPRH